jgi:hypothetical protein
MTKKGEGSWFKMRKDVLCSAAWSALSPPAKRILERLLVELMNHAGKDNGRLICTYPDFIKFGIREKSIPGGLRQLEDVGLIRVIRRGRITPDHSNPSFYLITFLPTDDAGPTDEWRHYLNTKQTRKMQKPGGTNAPRARGGNAPSTGGTNASPVDPQELGA